MTAPTTTGFYWVRWAPGRPRQSFYAPDHLRGAAPFVARFDAGAGNTGRRGRCPVTVPGSASVFPLRDFEWLGAAEAPAAPLEVQHAPAQS